MTLGHPMDCSPPLSSVHGFPRQEYWSGFPFPSPSNRCIAVQMRVMGQGTPPKCKDIISSHLQDLPLAHSELQFWMSEWVNEWTLKPSITYSPRFEFIPQSQWPGLVTFALCLHDSLDFGFLELWLALTLGNSFRSYTPALKACY